MSDDYNDLTDDEIGYVIKNRDTGEVVATYRTLQAAEAHLERFENDFLAKSPAA